MQLALVYPNTVITAMIHT